MAGKPKGGSRGGCLAAMIRLRRTCSDHCIAAICQRVSHEVPLRDELEDEQNEQPGTAVRDRTSSPVARTRSLRALSVRLTLVHGCAHAGPFLSPGKVSTGSCAAGSLEVWKNYPAGGGWKGCLRSMLDIPDLAGP